MTWEMTIRDEGLEEKNEKLRLSLRDPVNTIIGDRRKMGLRIINAENGTWATRVSTLHLSLIHISEPTRR